MDAVRGGGGLICYILAFILVPKTVRSLRAGFPEIALLVFITVGFLSTVWSVAPFTTFLKMIPLIATLLCMSRVTSMYESPEAALHSIIKVAHVILMATLVQLLIVPSATYYANISDPIPRLNSNFPSVSANILGVVIGIGLAGIILKCGPEWTRRQPVNFILSITYVCMLLATRSRMITAVVLLIVILLLWKVMQTSPVKAGVGWLVISSIGIVYWVLVSTENTVGTTARDFLLRGQESGSGLTTLTGRTVIWERAIPLWQEQPWIGYGYYSGHRLGLAAMDKLFENYSNLDNTWVETLVDVGICGTVGLFAFAVFGLLRISSTSQWGRGRPIAILVALSVIVMSFVNPTIQTNTPTLVFFAALVFSSRPERIRKKAPPQPSVVVRAA